MTNTEIYTGSDCTGSSGNANRTLTLSNTRITVDGGLDIIVSGLSLHPTDDFTISHQSSSSIITFVNLLWDDQPISVTYEVAGAPAGTTGGAGILPMHSQNIINEIDYFGSTITVRAVTDDSYSKWGDATESTSDDATIKAMVQTLTQADELVKEGIFQAGDKLFWFKPTETNINRGNRIQHNSLWYEIVEVIKSEVGDITYLIEARTKKV